jgi:hypothetical protein
VQRPRQAEARTVLRVRGRHFRLAAALSLGVCMGLFGGASSAAAQALPGPPHAEAGNGSESAVQGGGRSTTSAAPVASTAPHQEPSSNRALEQRPVTPDPEVRPTSSPPGRRPPEAEGPRGLGPSRGDAAPRASSAPRGGPSAPATRPPADARSHGGWGGPDASRDNGSLRARGDPANAARDRPTAPGARGQADSGSKSSRSPDRPPPPAGTRGPMSATRSAPVGPTPPPVGDTTPRGSVLAVRRHAAVVGEAPHAGRAKAGLDAAARTSVAIPLAGEAPVRDAGVTPTEVAPEQPRTVVGGTAVGPSAGSSSSASVGPLVLTGVLLIVLVLHWSGVLLARERWRRTVFLALPERPG